MTVSTEIDEIDGERAVSKGETSQEFDNEHVLSGDESEEDFVEST